MKVYLGGSLMNFERAHESNRKSSERENNLEGKNEVPERKSSHKKHTKDDKKSENDSEVNLNNRNISGSPTKLSNVFKLSHQTHKHKSENLTQSYTSKFDDEFSTSQGPKSKESNSSKSLSSDQITSQCSKSKNSSPPQSPNSEKGLKRTKSQNFSAFQSSISESLDRPDSKLENVSPSESRKSDGLNSEKGLKRTKSQIFNTFQSSISENLDSPNSKPENVNPSQSLKSDGLPTLKVHNPEDLPTFQVHDSENLPTFQVHKPEDLSTPHSYSSGNLNSPHKLKFKDIKRPQRPKSENLNSLGAGNQSQEGLLRSKSESYLFSDSSPGLRKQVLKKTLSKDNEDKSVNNILEDFMMIQAQRDPLLRKMFERNTRQIYKERLTQSVKQNLQERSSLNLESDSSGKRKLQTSKSQMNLHHVPEKQIRSSISQMNLNILQMQGRQLYASKSQLNLAQLQGKQFHTSKSQMNLNQLQGKQFHTSISQMNLNQLQGKQFYTSKSQMNLNQMQEEPTSPNGRETFAQWQKRRKLWIGVNGIRDRHQHHPLSSSSIDVGSPHYRNDSAPQTPHIIVSPECETQEPFFIYPEGAIGTQINRDLNEANVEDRQTSTSGDMLKNDSSDKETGTYGNQNSFSPESPTKIDQESLMKDESSTVESQITRNNTKIPSYLQYSADSSSSNSPEEERGQKFFSNELAVVEQGGQLDYHTRCNTLPHTRTDNNLSIVPSFHRSSSMVSLNPSDPYYRKTRKTSMMDIMRRVSSNSGLELRPAMERTVSKISLGTIITNNNNNSIDWQQQMNDSLILCVSALYAKLLVVMGMAFPMAEIISNDVPLILYHSFYLYLYFGSILFLIYAYIFLLRTKTISSSAIKNQMQSIKTKMPRLEVNWDAIPKPFRDVLPKKKKEPDGKLDKDDKISVATSAYKPPKYTITETNNHGSMYLKMGAVLFGIGSMIYSGLEFGQYFELRSGADCANILMAISPIARMIFTFLQMYFIFLNSRVAISKHTTIARFGFMHMIGTNLCIWLNVLVQETKHEIAHLTYSAGEHRADLFPGHSVESHSKENSVLGSHSKGSHNHHDAIDNDHHDNSLIDSFYNKSDAAHNIVRRTADDLEGCRRINLMGNVVSSASPFLFPCTIEYSLLCAGVLYVMWKNINVSKNEKNAADGDSDISTFIARKVRHHYSVDCARASRGLFTGIFILVLTIISLILFYVLISNENFKSFAILEANIIELSIYSLAIISVIVGMKQMRELEFILEGDIELDNILLIIAQAGVYIYASFTIIGGYFSLQSSHTLPLLTAILTLLQTTLQTLFILDGSRRCCSTADQLDRKPGREMVTFLLVCNLAMWAISTFETSRADVHPTQLHFYGIWAWTIISHVSMPLAIFYRFHVTVCLGEIWKRSYKLKQEFIGL